MSNQQRVCTALDVARWLVKSRRFSSALELWRELSLQQASSSPDTGGDCETVEAIDALHEFLTTELLATPGNEADGTQLAAPIPRTEATCGKTVDAAHNSLLTVSRVMVERLPTVIAAMDPSGRESIVPLLTCVGQNHPVSSGRCALFSQLVTLFRRPSAENRAAIVDGVDSWLETTSCERVAAEMMPEVWSLALHKYVECRLLALDLLSLLCRRGRLTIASATEAVTNILQPLTEDGSEVVRVSLTRMLPSLVHFCVAVRCDDDDDGAANGSVLTDLLHLTSEVLLAAASPLRSDAAASDRIRRVFGEVWRECFAVEGGTLYDNVTWSPMSNNKTGPNRVQADGEQRRLFFVTAFAVACAAAVSQTGKHAAGITAPPPAGHVSSTCDLLAIAEFVLLLARELLVSYFSWVSKTRDERRGKPSREVGSRIASDSDFFDDEPWCSVATSVIGALRSLAECDRIASYCDAAANRPESSERTVALTRQVSALEPIAIECCRLLIALDALTRHASVSALVVTALLPSLETCDPASSSAMISRQVLLMFSAAVSSRTGTSREEAPHEPPCASAHVPTQRVISSVLRSFGLEAVAAGANNASSSAVPFPPTRLVNHALPSDMWLHCVHLVPECLLLYQGSLTGTCRDGIGVSTLIASLWECIGSPDVACRCGIVQTVECLASSPFLLGSSVTSSAAHAPSTSFQRSNFAPGSPVMSHAPKLGIEFISRIAWPMLLVLLDDESPVVQRSAVTLALSLVCAMRGGGETGDTEDATSQRLQLQQKILLSLFAFAEGCGISSDVMRLVVSECRKRIAATTMPSDTREILLYELLAPLYRNVATALAGPDAAQLRTNGDSSSGGLALLPGGQLVKAMLADTPPPTNPGSSTWAIAVELLELAACIPHCAVLTPHIVKEYLVAPVRELCKAVERHPHVTIAAAPSLAASTNGEGGSVSPAALKSNHVSKSSALAAEVRTKVPKHLKSLAAAVSKEYAALELCCNPQGEQRTFLDKVRSELKRLV